MSFPKKLSLCSLLIVFSVAFPVRAQETEVPLTPPRPIRVGTSPSKHSLLVYPDEHSDGRVVSDSERSEAAPINRRYVETPNPEDVPKKPLVRTVSGTQDSAVIVQAGDAVSIPRSPFPSIAQEDTTFIRPAVDLSSAESPGPSRRPRPASDSVGSLPVEIDPYHPPVRTAAFLNVVPGETTLKEVLRFWGRPVRETTVQGELVQLFSTPVLNHIEVFYKDELVKSIVVRLDEPFPEEQVREVLKSELLKSKPVLIPDETGRIIGEVFPEKGVLFLFEESESPRDHVYLVNQIGIEPVDAEPFVLRAEATLKEHPKDARRDLLDALRLQPKAAKAYWLLSCIELMEGHVDAARLHAEKALQYDERRPAYHLTLAETFFRMNRIEDAKFYLEEMLGICDRFPHEKARALSLLGDLYRMSPQPDYEAAIDFHSDAIRLATALIDHANPTIRRTAKDVLFEAHLGAARDIAWGRWDEKAASIEKWIAQARDIADDSEMISAKRFSMEYPFKLASAVLACQVGLPDDHDIEPAVRDVLHAGEKLVQSTDDPILQRKYQWETSLSLYDAVQIYQIRKRYTSALKYGEIAADYMEAGVRDRKSDLDLYLLARLYFRLGAIHAIGNRNHRAAIEWFDRAKPVFEKVLPKVNPEELGRLGETLVSMGVSYWMTGQREEAVRLTERGLKQIERGVKLGVLEQSAFRIPYANLESMYRELGNTEHALRYARLAAQIQ